MAGWPSPAERRALDSFPQQIGPEDLDEHFKLLPAGINEQYAHFGSYDVIADGAPGRRTAHTVSLGRQ